ncbi:hypothetical protein Tco_0539658 [Tanacetum coccineum]
MFKQRLAANIANGTCKEVQLKLTTTINAETGTNNTKSKDNKEKKRFQNINSMVFHNVIEIEDSEQQQNVEPTKKARTTIEPVGLRLATLRFVEEPVEILDREVKSLKHSKIALVKVRWNSKRGLKFTWEREDYIKSKYPLLFVVRVDESAS